jgi:hypothetical protein
MLSFMLGFPFGAILFIPEIFFHCTLGKGGFCLFGFAFGAGDGTQCFVHAG